MKILLDEFQGGGKRVKQGRFESVFSESKSGD